MGQHALDHLAAQPRDGADAVGKADLVADFERDAEGGEGGVRQAGALEQRMQAGAAAIVQQRGDARQRQIGQLGQRES